MSKYVGGMPTVQPKVNPIQQGVLSGIENFQKSKATEQAKTIINDPNSTAIQKAMALANLGQEKLSSDFYKGSIKEAEIAAKTSTKSTIDQSLNTTLNNIRNGGGNGATSPIRENTAATNLPFSTSGPNRAAANALEKEPQNVTQPNTNTQPAQVKPEAPPVVQLSPEEQEMDVLGKEADAYDKAATEYAEINPTQSRNHKDTANNKRKQVEKIKDRANDQKIADDKEKVRVDKGQEKTYNKIINDAEHAQEHLRSSEVAKNAIATGNVGTKGIAGLKRAFFKGTKWEEFFKNEDHALLEAAALEEYTGMKDMFGTRLSDADLKVVGGKVISPYKSDEANLAIIDYRQFQDKMKIAKAEVADQIIDENGGYKPYNFSQKIRQRMGQLYGQEADKVIENALYEGKPSPKPSPQDPLMESAYGKVPEGRARLKKGSEVITIPYAYLQDALADEFELLEKGAE